VTFQQALDWLNGTQFTGIKLGLDNTRHLLAAVENPENRLRFIHVAGTNGKGSVCAMLDSCLRAAGYRTGLFTSPHLIDFQERIRVNGVMISPQETAAGLSRLCAASKDWDHKPTFFELSTVLALDHFERSSCDIVVLETGMGGRLDATNVVTPLVSVITPIAMDHMLWLGDDISKIAAEKAGIIKRGCPVVSGAVHPAARRVIEATARRRPAPLLQLGRDFHAVPAAEGRRPAGVIVGFPDGSRHCYRVGMAGRHQADNAALAAVTARELDGRGLPVPERAIAAGIASVRLPARIETVSRAPLVIVDAAHNVASMEALIETLASADKQIEKMLRPLTGMLDRVIVTRYLENPRAAPFERLRSACASAGLPRPLEAANPREALRLARSFAGRSGAVLVAGSFFLAGEICDG